MKKTTIGYWIFTILLLLFMAPGAVMEILNIPSSAAVLNHLNYPLYLSPFLGTAKLLGSLAILIPGYPRIKEWAYAGFVFDLTGAAYSGLASGDSILAISPIFIGYIFIAGSYTFYHKKLRQHDNSLQHQGKISLG